MVTSLATPDVDDVELTKEIILERQRGSNKSYFNDYKEKWLERVTEYIEKSGDPNKIDSSFVSEDDGGKFINLYTHPQDDSCHGPVIAKMRDTDLLFCPACGEDGKPETLDHYLPKTKYPEYSLLTKNLYPMCSKCQGIKLAEVLDSYGNRQFIHPYFDTVEMTLLAIRFSPPYSSPKGFVIDISENIPDPLKSLVKRHVHGLDIDSRLRDFCEEKYLHLLKLAEQSRNNGRRISDHLPAFRDMEAMKSLNAWGMVFYNSVLSDPDVMNYLDSGTLPDFL